ncbi:MAG: hydroxymethylglutaryl-CoA lyase [Bacteroidota bacterium]|nr:hydroxymethylglutaryl-CoA lyase [Candidatus Kapabacteria bacterium]MDW8219199.1 hydroxymethylglutaryl-CoA lyase [Bacteroidota bacterium]
MLQLPNSVLLEEQGLRDGLQMLPESIPTEYKLNLVERLIDAGLKRLQVCSFVNPKLVPQMADAEELCKLLPKRDDIVFSALTLNVKGVERAVQAGLRHIAVSLSASNAHSQKNAHKTLNEALEEFKQMVRVAKDTGIQVRGGIQSAFGCRYEGHIPETRVLELVRHHIDCGVDEIALADSTGMGYPLAIQRVMQEVLRLAQGKPVILHLHDTENKGLANLYAALEVGVSVFDTAFGGLGGCPFIRGATGNIATEDTAHFLYQMGISSGVDVRKLAAISSDFATFLGRPLPGKLYKIVQRSDVQWEVR